MYIEYFIHEPNLKAGSCFEPRTELLTNLFLDLQLDLRNLDLLKSAMNKINNTIKKHSIGDHGVYATHKSHAHMCVSNRYIDVYLCM